MPKNDERCKNKHYICTYYTKIIEAVSYTHLFLIGMFIPEIVSSIFTSDAELISIASKGFRVVAVSYTHLNDYGRLIEAAKHLRLVDKEQNGKGSEIAEIILYGIMKNHYKACLLYTSRCV